MRVKMGGETVGGRKPVVSETVHDYGHKGGSGEAPLKQSMIAGEGAKDPGTGKKQAPVQVNGAAGAPEFQTTNTLTEEREKKLAGRMYPSSRGLAKYGA